MPQAPKIIQEIVGILRREGVCRAHKAVSLEAPEGGPAAPPAKTGDVANPSPDIMLPPFTEDNEESLLFSPGGWGTGWAAVIEPGSSFTGAIPGTR